jgi:hypothetical protein
MGCSVKVVLLLELIWSQLEEFFEWLIEIGAEPIVPG